MFELLCIILFGKCLENYVIKQIIIKGSSIKYVREETGFATHPPPVRFCTISGTQKNLEEKFDLQDYEGEQDVKYLHYMDGYVYIELEVSPNELLGIDTVLNWLWKESK